jgi:hypothetical protein
MSLIGYSSNKTHNAEFLDEVVEFSGYASLHGDYLVDVSNGVITADIKKWLCTNTNVGAFYGDFVDSNGSYSLHSLFPSVRTMYPGIIYKGDLLRQCTTSNPLEEIAKTHIISYIPEPFFRITE